MSSAIFYNVCQYSDIKIATSHDTCKTNCGRMPKAKGNINYAMRFVVQCIEEWDALREHDSHMTQKEYAASKGVKLETFRTWLKKRSQGRIFMSTPNQIQNKKKKSTGEELIIQRVSVMQEPTLKNVEAEILANEPSLIANKGYHAKRRTVERLIQQSTQVYDHKQIAQNMMADANIPRVDHLPTCQCQLWCGYDCPKKSK